MMIDLDGVDIRYEILGTGTPVVLTPGGRLGGDSVRTTAELLAEHYQVLLWDRRNTGASSVWFGYEPEQTVWADDLAALLKRLDLAPAYLLGASAGARLSYLTAIRHPDVVAALAIWSVSGGPYASQTLGFEYHVPFIRAAMQGGMEAVAATPFFAERIERNPSNRDRLLSMRPDDFIAIMHHWNTTFFYRPDTPVIAATTDQLRTIACPTLVFEGNDDVHPPEAALALHRLVEGSELAPLPWTTDEWTQHLMGAAPGSVMALYPRLVPSIVEFLAGLPEGDPVPRTG